MKDFALGAFIAWLFYTLSIFIDIRSELRQINKKVK